MKQSNEVGMNIQETMDSLQALHDMNRVLVMHVEGSEVLSYLIWGKNEWFTNQLEAKGLDQKIQVTPSLGFYI